MVRRNGPGRVGRCITIAIFLVSMPQAQGGPGGGTSLCLPVNGESHAYLSPIDDAIAEYMCGSSARDLQAASVAISRDGDVVYRRTLGWSDPDHLYELQPNALMRVGSLSKPMTAPKPGRWPFENVD